MSRAMTMVRWGGAAALAVTAAGGAATACAPPECQDQFDCPLGWSCSVDGACVAGAFVAPARGADQQFEAGGPAAPPGDVSAVGPGGFSVEVASSGEALPSTLDGNIANLETTGVAAARITPVDWESVDLFVAVADKPSTFVAVYRLPFELLLTPGDHVVREPTTLDDPVGQACNYDTTEYDETIVDIAIHVPVANPGDAELPVALDFRSTYTTASAAVSLPLRW
jgi:hypothetical protein